MKVRFILFILLFILISTADTRAETAIRAEVEKTSITTDETIAYKLMITSSEKKIPQPKLPEFNEFTVLSRAETSEISISKGKQETFVVYVFIIAPTKIGRLKIAPAQIQIEKNTFSSQSFEIEVTQGKKQTQPESGEDQVRPKEVPQEPGQPKITL